MGDEQRPASAPAGAKDRESGFHAGLAPGEAVKPATTAAADTTAGAAADTPTSDAVGRSERASQLEFELAVDVIYHRSREAWFTGLHRAVMFGTILLGAGVITNAAPTLSGLGIALLGALDLALDLTGQASAHAHLRRRYLGLVSKLAADNYSDARCLKTEKAILAMAGDEPPPYLAAQAQAFNQAIFSLGWKRAPQMKLSGMQYWLRHLRRYEGAAFA